MTPVVLIGALLAVPVLLLMLLRINAAIIFLSLCLGNVLVQYVAPDASSFLWMFSKHIDPKNTPFLSLILLLAPTVFTMVVMIRTVHGRFKLALNLLPAAAVGAVATLLVVPLLPAGLREPIMGAPLWATLQKFQTLAVGAGAMLSMLVLWVQRPKAGTKMEKGDK